MDYIQNPEFIGGMPGASTLGTPDTPPKKKPGTNVDSRPEQGADIDMDAIRREAATAEALNKYKERGTKRTATKTSCWPNSRLQLGSST